MNKIKPITVSNFYDRWLKPYVDTRGDNLLECEGQLYSLINSTREECAKIVEKSTLISDSLLSRHKAVKELQFEIAKTIRDSKC